MKILESRPRRYDRGINLLSLGQSEKIKKRIAADFIRPGLKILEIGCGTGTLALLCVQKGADVVGFDVSPSMLSIARDKAKISRFSKKIELLEMGVAGMDKFADASFDLIVSTLVFSELSPDEQKYALRHSYRVLKSGGRLVIADEKRPARFSKRLVHSALRLPLLLLTFILTQTTTKAVVGLPDLISDSGFKIEFEKKSSGDSFVYVAAIKEVQK